MFRISTSPECPICAELSRGHFSKEKQISRIIFSSDNFVVLPSLGPIQPGHLLICSKAHVTGLQYLNEGQLLELSEVQSYVSAILERQYMKTVLCFENGTESGGQGGCSITHFHMHVIPVPSDMSICSLGGNEERVCADLADAKIHALDIGNYTLFKYDKDPIRIFPRPENSSQYMRKKVSNLVGNKFWDWRSYPKEDDVLQSVPASRSIAQELPFQR